MTGIILSIVLSGGLSLFISHKYLRNRMGIGMAVMFLVPAFSCAAYIYLTSPHFSPFVKTQEQRLEAAFEKNADNIDNMLALANFYISDESYDKAISLLESSEKHANNEKLLGILAKAYFAKGLLFAEQESYEDALTYLQNARSIAPENIDFLPDLDHFIKIVKENITASQ